MEARERASLIKAKLLAIIVKMRVTLRKTPIIGNKTGRTRKAKKLIKLM